MITIHNIKYIFNKNNNKILSIKIFILIICNNVFFCILFFLFYSNFFSFFNVIIDSLNYVLVVYHYSEMTGIEILCS